MTLRIGIDVGGTFTDVTAFDDRSGEIVVSKYLSDPAAPVRVMETITAELAEKHGADAVSLVLHGSTAALNTLLEGKGVRAGLLTTRGFRDVYEIGRQWRGDDVFNIFAPAPKMLLTRDRIHEVGERLDARGAVIEPLRPRRRGAGGPGAAGARRSRRSQSASCSPTPIRDTSRRPPPSSARSRPSSTSRCRAR